jgi:SPP1 gp7 family putative phage head morphogenesis protein
MEFSTLRDWTRQTILTVFGVTKTVLGISDDVNRANAKEALRVFWEITVLPIVMFLEDEIGHKMLRRAEGMGSDYRVKFDISGVSVLKEDVDSKVDRVLKLATEGGLSLRDAAVVAEWHTLAELAGKIEGLDERWIKSDRLPHGIAVNPPAPGGGAAAPVAADASPAITKDADAEPATEEPTPEEIAAEAAEVERRSAAVWKSHDEFLKTHEAKVSKAAHKILKNYVLAVRIKLRTIGKKNAGAPVVKYVASDAEVKRALSMNEAEWAKAMAAEVMPKIEATLMAAAKELHVAVSGEGAVLAVTDPAIVSFMAAKEVTLAEGSMTTLAKDVQKRIVSVLAGATDATSMADAIREVLEKLEKDMKIMVDQMGARAEMIARTEVNSATSFARTEQMAEDGIEKHTWISSRDGAVRPSHSQLDQTTRTVGKEFGYGLKFPGDGNAAAGEIINCRCTTIPIF